MKAEDDFENNLRDLILASKVRALSLRVPVRVPFYRRKTFGVVLTTCLLASLVGVMFTPEPYMFFSDFLFAVSWAVGCDLFVLFSLEFFLPFLGWFKETSLTIEVQTSPLRYAAKLTEDQSISSNSIVRLLQGVPYVTPAQVAKAAMVAMQNENPAIVSYDEANRCLRDGLEQLKILKEISE